MLHTYYEAPNYWTPRWTAHYVDPPAVFLAGGITGCERWHDEAVRLISHRPEEVIVLSPNRQEFPAGDPAEELQQVQWEQHHLHLPEVATLMWFPACPPEVAQPFALFELGQAWGEGRRIVVGADPGYGRGRFVRWLADCTDPDIPVFGTLEETVDAALMVAVTT